MADEIELKLALPEGFQPLFLRQPVLKEATSRQRQQLLSIYYDTPRQDLRRRGIALRLRRQGSLWLQTVKCAGEGVAGLTRRQEWETAYGGHFDFAAVGAPELRQWLERPKIRDHLQPYFETAFRRTLWRFDRPGGGAVLLMLDRGWIAAGGRREAISEVEVELAGAPPEDLVALASRLAEKVPLAPAVQSKAERGYRLHEGEALAPQKACDASLTADQRPLDAFRTIALACLEQIAANHPGAVASEDPEFIHQMRVGARRLRACLRLFAPLLPEDLVAGLLPPLRELMGLLGEARDFDVLLAEIVLPVTAALPDEPRLAALAGVVTDRRYAARAAAAHALGSARYGRLMLSIFASLQEQVFGAGDHGQTLAAFAAERLARLRKKVRRLAAAAHGDDPLSLHALRIAVKRLRYALEFFAPLAEVKAGGRSIARLAAIQDVLGQLNDLANAGRLLESCAGDDRRLREAVTLVGSWHGPRHGQLLDRVPGLIEEVRRLRLPPLA